MHRRYLVQLMQQYTRLKEFESDDVGVALVVDAELFRLDAVTRWLDAADARLRRQPSEPETTTSEAATPRLRRRVEVRP